MKNEKVNEKFKNWANFYKCTIFTVVINYGFPVFFHFDLLMIYTKSRRKFICVPFFLENKKKIT